MATTTFAGSDTIIRGFFHNDGYYHLGGLVVYFLITFVISNATYGISVPSGLFVPCILMGCSFGRFYGEILRYYVFPGQGIVPGTYALMGAVGKQLFFCFFSDRADSKNVEKDNHGARRDGTSKY